MSFRSEKLYPNFASAFFFVICFVLFGLSLQAQTKKPTTAQTNKKQPPSIKVSIKANSSSNKTPVKAQDAAKKTTAKEKLTAKEKQTEKSKTPSKVELARQSELKRQEEARQREIEKRQDAIRQAEESRRRAALEEKRRREQAAREARERQLAFERGLKTETLENIANDDTQGEDLEVRRAAVNALSGHAGTVVVIEPQTGKVLSIVNQEWGIRKGFKPCSTIKLVTGAAGLDEKKIDANGSIRSRRFPMELNDALAFSNNTYFQAVGAGLGNGKMISYARALGLGAPTGINAKNEASGKLPFGNNNARIYSHGDDFEVTPLQLAVLVSTISNGGKMVVPQIPRNAFEKTNFRGTMRRQVNVSPTTLQSLLPGMIGAVNYGTARRSNGSAVNAAGKTGSCIGQGTWLGLFASIAPVVNPKLAVVVITRGASERGKYASAIAGKVYKALSNRIRENDGKEFIAKVPLTLKPQPKVNAVTSAIVDNVKGEDSEDNDAVNIADIKQETSKRPNPKKGGDDAIIVAKKTNSSSVKSPVKSMDKLSDKPSTVFSPIVIQINREPSRPRVVQMNNK